MSQICMSVAKTHFRIPPDSRRQLILCMIAPNQLTALNVDRTAFKYYANHTHPLDQQYPAG